MCSLFYLKLLCWTAVVCACFFYTNALHHCSPLYGHEGCNFRPAPPGHVPQCARPGQTYCEKVSHYPMQLIKYLVDKWGFDHTTLISDETKDDFNAYRLSSYTPRGSSDFVYGPPNYVPPNPLYPEPINVQKHHHFLGHQNIGNTYGAPPANRGTNYTVPFTGYPDRTPAYPLHHNHLQYPNNNHLQHQYHNNPYVYSTINTPHITPQEWWNRLKNLTAILVHDLFFRYTRANTRFENHRNRRSPATKEKPRSKNVPKSESFKALISRKPPRRTNETGGVVALRRDKRQEFLALLEEIAEEPSVARRSRFKRQALNGEQLCTTQSEFIMPKAALNNQGNWMYVVNLQEVDMRYTQLVKAETCLGQQCSNLCNLPAGYTARCEQKYVQKRLVALEGAGQRLYNDIFWFPSCCVCTISAN